MEANIEIHSEKHVGPIGKERPFVIIGLVALLLSLGCVLVACDNRSNTQALKEFSEKLQELEATCAHRDEVRAQLGEPSSVFEAQRDGKERWVYHYPYPDQPFKYGAVLTFDPKTGSLLRYSNTVAHFAH